MLHFCTQSRKAASSADISDTVQSAVAAEHYLFLSSSFAGTCQCLYVKAFIKVFQQTINRSLIENDSLTMFMAATRKCSVGVCMDLAVSDIHDASDLKKQNNIGFIHKSSRRKKAESCEASFARQSAARHPLSIPQLYWSASLCLEKDIM